MAQLATEYERTYLCDNRALELTVGEPVAMLDVYLPEMAEHPNLRIRMCGNKCEITRKSPLVDDPSRMIEETMSVSAEEFQSLRKSSNRKIEKLRYKLKYKNFAGELDVFKGEHTGLILVDFEFRKEEDLELFTQPDFVIAEVTYEDAIAGGILSGMGRTELSRILSDKYDYHY